MTKSKTIPYGFWNARKEELRRCADSMTNSELAAKFQVTNDQIRNALYSFGVKRVAQKTCWKSREAELRDLAPKMTTRELAAHFDTSMSNIYERLSQFGLSSMQYQPTAKFPGGIEALLAAAPTMTKAELCEKFGICISTVRKYLSDAGASCKPTRHSNRKWTSEHKAEIEKMIAARMKIIEIAEHFGTTEANVRRRMQLFGMMKPHPTSVVPKIQVKPKKKIAAPKGCTNAICKPSRPGRIPGSSVIIPNSKKVPAEIIMPADAKITISHFNPPPGTRICNGSSYERYDPKARTVGARWGY